MIALKAAGYDVEVIHSGCCGMASDLGYETDYYEVSLAIAEDRLMPAVRTVDAGMTIIASGTSYRHQIRDLSEREPVHLVVALAAALGGMLLDIGTTK